MTLVCPGPVPDHGRAGSHARDRGIGDIQQHAVLGSEDHAVAAAQGGHFISEPPAPMLIVFSEWERFADP